MFRFSSLTVSPVSRYVDRMKPDQKYVYYLAADSKKSAQTAPFLEQVNEKGFEVSSPDELRTTCLFLRH